MEYDFRKRASAQSYPTNVPSYGRVPSSSSSSADSQPPHSLYPQIGTAPSHAPPPSRNHPPFHHAPPPPSNNSGLGIRVAIKPDYRITPPPALLPHLGEIPRSNFHFDFEFERNVLIEGVKENPNWARLGIEIAPPPPPPPRAAEPPSSHVNFQSG